MKQLVLISGGFHPFHPGHLSLYQAAKETFPGADVVVAATNDTSSRPFPFKIKQKLAQVSGVPPRDFVEVSRQFNAVEPAISRRIKNPIDTVLIFVRSDKDQNQPPLPTAPDPATGQLPLAKRGPNKGQPVSDYLQYLAGNENNIQPMTQHAYMAYLPTVEFGPGMQSATQIRTAWPQLNEKRKTALVMSLYPKTQTNPKLAATVVKMLDTAMGSEQAVAEDLSRRGFLKKAAGAAAAGAAMSAAGPEIVTLVKGFAEKAGGLNGIQALKAMLKVATAEELYNMYEYQADSGILEDAITDSDMIALDRAGYDDWSEFEEHCDENGVDADDEFKRLTGRPLTVILVQDILEKIDNTWSLEDYFEQYPDALKIINPFENGSISMPTMRQLAKIDTAAKGASLPAPIVAMANAVAGLVRQIFKSNGQPLAAPQQVAQTGRAAPALPAPTRPEFDMTPDLKTKQQVPVQRQGHDEEQYYRPAPEHIQQALDAGQLGDKNFFQSIVDGTDKNPWVTPEKAQEILNKYYGPQKPNEKQAVAEGRSNDTAISLSRLGKFHPGADTLAEFVPERATAQYALHPDKWESTFYSLTNKDSDKLKYYGPKKISIPPGTLVGDMAIANKFYRAKTSEEKQQYAEAYKASLQPYPVDVSEYRMPELLIPKQGVAENADYLNESR